MRQHGHNLFIDRYMADNNAGKKVLAALFAVLTVIVLADQARFLYVYPVTDTGMWFGDETWTMLTVRALARTGVARVPEALGSSLAHSNGLINGSIWISGLLYGAPASALSNIASPVAIGRTITFLLTLVCLFFVYRLARTLGASKSVSWAGIVTLVISNAFYFSSHSARLDMITGLCVLLFLFFFQSALDRTVQATSLARYAFAIPFFTVLSIAVYVHVPTLIALPAVYSLWKIGAFRRWQTIALSIAGFILGIVLIVGIYWFSTGSFSLLGYGYNQYYNVANSLPVLHLLSWRVQKINTLDRAVQVWHVAWPLVITIVFGIAARIWKRTPIDRRERFYFSNVILLLISWTLFCGPAVFYNIYVLPALAICGAVLLAPLAQSVAKVLVSLLIVAAIIASTSQERFGHVGERLVTENERAIHALIDPISSELHPPLVLTDEPAINELAADPTVRLMTNHLLLFGSENRPLPDILHEYHVKYLLLYSTVRWHSPVRQIADSLYTFVGERTGTLTDQARSYDDPAWNDTDTLRLYRAR